MKIKFIILLGIVLMASCKDKKANSNNISQDQVSENTYEQTKTQTSDTNLNPYYEAKRIVIEGYVKDGANGNVILDRMGRGEIVPLQSVLVNEMGGFIIEETIPEPGIYRLRFPNGAIDLYLRGGRVKINTDISALIDYEIIGSPESYHLKEMYLMLNEFSHEVSAVQDRFEKLKLDKSKKKEMLQCYDSLNIYYEDIDKRKTETIKKFITRIDTSMIALEIAFYLDANKEYDFMMEVLNKFEKIAPHSKSFLQYKEKMAMIIPTGAGYEAPEIVLEDKDGNEHALLDLKGNVILLYFWASYDEPSRNANKDLMSLYYKYQSKKFKIYTVSVDSEKTDWIKAINEDKMSSITNVSNLLGWEDEVAYVYNISSLPYLILIDKEGKIINRGFTINEAESYLKGILK